MTTTARTGKTVVLLRAVNVGGNNRLPMQQFRDLLTDLGATEVTTYVQSGNAVVDLPARGLTAKVEAALSGIGLNVRAVITTGAAIAQVVEANPFPHLVDRPKQLHVAFFADGPDQREIEDLGLQHGDDEWAAGERCLYLAYNSSMHDSPLTKPMRKVSGVWTARNWTTVLALRDLAT